MTKIELNRLERDVEDARERLSGDLQRLRSPATLSAFKEAIWAEADESRDQIVAKAKETVDELVVKARAGVDELVAKSKEGAGDLVVTAKESVDELVAKTKEGAGELVAATQEAVRDRAWSFLAEIKERAAANPVAALAIGAGLAWRIAQKPPIASLLVGAGVIGLMRTNARETYAGAGVAAQVVDFAGEAKEKIEQWTVDAGDIAARAGEVASEVAGSVKGTVEEWSAEAGDAVWRVAVATKSLTDRGSEAIYGIAQNPEERDKYLLGAAALALVASVGFACQRRAS